MRPAALVVWVIGLLAAGCTGPNVPSAVPSASPRDSAPSVASVPPPIVHPAVVLRADLGERPAGWTRVAFIPFGDRPDQLGYRIFADSPASQPSAFAVDEDGSLWIVDRWKKRVAHFSAQGRFLDAATGLYPRGWDVALVDRRVFVLVEQATGTIGTVHDGIVDKVDLSIEGRPLFAFQLIPTSRGLVAQAGRVPGGHDGEFGTFVVVHPADPAVTEILPGLPLGRDGAHVDAEPAAERAHPGGDQDFDFTFSSPEIVQVQPVQIELIAHPSSGTRSIPAEVGLLEPLPVGEEDVLLYVEIAPTRPDDADAFGGGRWILRVGVSPLLWERLPDPEVSDELHHRHLAVGPDGTIYLMVTQREGMLILRRSGTVSEAT